MQLLMMSPQNGISTGGLKHGKPYVNGFKFMHVEDYNVVSVEAGNHVDKTVYPVSRYS